MIHSKLEEACKWFGFNHKILLPNKPRKEHKARIKDGFFAFCELCERWIEVDESTRDEEGYVSLPLTTALDKSNRWICSECWDIVDIALYGPYHGYEGRSLG